MIPKVIHYCWFGGNPKPESFKRYYASWKKYCPDYEIKEWNESNFDVNCCSYVAEAYKMRKWAFVTDYARLWIIYTYGGIYLDTDVEIVKPLDGLLNNHAYFGFESTGIQNDQHFIATGLGFGAEINNSVVYRMLKDYSNEHFIREDGSLNLQACPVRNTASVRKLLPNNYSGNEIIRIDGATIFPSEYFCPLDASGIQLHKTKNTYSIHWYTASWLNEDQMVVHKYRIFRNKCQRLFGEKVGDFLARLVYLLKPKERNVLKKM